MSDIYEVILLRNNPSSSSSFLSLHKTTGRHMLLLFSCPTMRARMLLISRSLYPHLSRLSLFIILLLFRFDFFLIGGCRNVVDGATTRAEVESFPGYEGPMPSKHYSGYITVGDKIYRKHVYYYFATSEKNPLEDPVTIFFMGGPGCSGLSALVHLLGPFRVVHNPDYLTAGAKVEMSPFSWTKFTNMIYLDFPEFAGYSYAEAVSEDMGHDLLSLSDWSNFVLNSVVNDTSNGNEIDHTREINDTETVSDLYEFIKTWFSEFPEFLSNPFYVAGSSYGGVYVPTVANEIVKGIEAGDEPNINFKGYSSGNAAINVDIEHNAKVPFAHNMGLIPDELYEDLVKYCNGKYWNNDDPQCLEKLKAFDKILAGTNDYHMLCLPCHTNMGHEIPPYEHESVRLYHSLKEKPEDDIYCFDYSERATRLFSPQSSREKLHALKEEVTGKWIRCPKYRNYKRNLLDLIPYHLNLTSKGYRAFIYTGDHDMVIPPAANLQWIKQLNYSVVADWRPWFVEGHIAGYTVQYDNNLVFATFKGAGHVVPDFMPQEAAVAHERWLGGSDSL